jgi:hypothetical protein
MWVVLPLNGGTTLVHAEGHLPEFLLNHERRRWLRKEALMSRRILKVLLLSAMLASALASSASATNWTSNGPGNYTATAPAAKLTTTTPSGVGTLCLTNSATGSLNGPTGPVNTGTWDEGTFQPVFINCTLGGSPAAVNCENNAHLIGVSQDLTIVHGHLTNIRCWIAGGGCGAFAAGPPRSVTAVGLTVTGEVTGDYDNSLGILTVLPAGQSLTVASSATPGCDTLTGWTSGARVWFGAQFGSNTTPLGKLGFTVTSTFKPNIQHN